VLLVYFRARNVYARACLCRPDCVVFSCHYLFTLAFGWDSEITQRLELPSRPGVSITEWFMLLCFLEAVVLTCWKRTKLLCQLCGRTSRLHLLAYPR
jgi:hypothetical protein